MHQKTGHHAKRSPPYIYVIINARMGIVLRPSDISVSFLVFFDYTKNTLIILKIKVEFLPL